MDKNTLSLESHLEEIQAVESLHSLFDKFHSQIPGLTLWTAVVGAVWMENRCGAAIG